MKKLAKNLLVVILGLVLLCTFVACSGGSDSGSNYDAQSQNSTTQNTTNDSVSQQTQSKTEERIELTKSNINDYLTFSVRVSDVEIEDTFMNNEMGDCYLTMKSSSKKAVEFDNVVLKVRFDTSSSGWPNSAEHTIEIPYDGKAEYSTDTSSFIESYVSSSPSFKVNVISVQGYVIIK